MGGGALIIKLAIDLVFVAVVLGLLPPIFAAFTVRAWPKDHPRRREVLAELGVIPFKDRPFFVFWLFGLAIVEGLPARWGGRRHAGATTRTQDSVLRFAEPGYTRRQACAVVGISELELTLFDATGLVSPSVAMGQAGGVRRGYSYSDLVQLNIIKRCVGAGLRFESIRRAIDYLRESGEKAFDANLVVDDCWVTLLGRNVTVERVSVFAYLDAEVIRLPDDGYLDVVSIRGVDSEVRTAISKLATVVPEHGLGPKESREH